VEIQNGTYYNLGPRTFWLLVAGRSTAAVGFVLAAILIGGLRDIVGANTQLSPMIAMILYRAMIGGIILVPVTELFGIIAARLEYNVSKVMLDDSSLHIIHGILSKEETAIPYRRIQSTEIKQSLLQRMFGVAHVAIASTTDLEQPNVTENETDEEVIPVMDYALAQAVANILMNRAETERMQVQQSNARS